MKRYLLTLILFCGCSALSAQVAPQPDPQPVSKTAPQAIPQAVPQAVPKTAPQPVIQSIPQPVPLPTAQPAPPPQPLAIPEQAPQKPAALPQIISLSGRVLSAADSTAIPGATIMREGGRPNTMADTAGRFRLRDLKPGKFGIEVVMMGYKHRVIQVSATANKNLGDIYLETAPYAMGSVTVTAPAPMAIQLGDTTQFNAAAFKTNPDADADELLAKMPGVLIQDGKIQAQGEQVRKIYVDGKLFFGNDPMAAIKSLPADAVESIQLFDDLTDQAKYSGFEDGETVKAINIVTKGKTKKATLFKAEVAGGRDLQGDKDNRFFTGGNFSYFTSKHRITLTGLFNNTNTTKFGQSEMEEVDVDNYGNIIGQLAGVSKVAGGGLNYSLETKTIKLTFDYLFDRGRNLTDRFSHTAYFPTPRFTSQNVYRLRNSNILSFNQAFNLRVILTLNKQNTITVTSNNSFRDTDQQLMRDSVYRDRNDRPDYWREYDNPSLIESRTLYQNIFWSYRWPEKRARSFTTSLTYRETLRETDRALEYLQAQNYYTTRDAWYTPSYVTNKITDQYTPGAYLQAKMTFTEPIGRHRILFTLIGRTEWGSDDKTVEDYRQTRDHIGEGMGEYRGKNELQSSSFKRRYNSFGGGMGYSYVQKRYRLTVSMDYLKMKRMMEQFAPRPVKAESMINDWQPKIVFRYNLQKRRYLRFDYNGRTVLPNIQYLQDVATWTDRWSVTIGNPYLKDSYRHAMKLFYNSTDIKRSTNFTLNLEGRLISDMVSTVTYIMPEDVVVHFHDEEIPLYKGATYRTYANLDGYVYTRLDATYSFSVRPIRSNLSLSLGYGYVCMPSIYDVLNYANTHAGNFRVGLTSNVSQNVDFNIYSNTVISNTINSKLEDTSFINENLSFSLNLIFWKGIVFNSIFTWRYFDSEGPSLFSDKYYILNASLGKKFLRNQNAEFRVTCFDLLGQNRDQRHYVRNSGIEDVTFNTLQRYVLFRLMYRFNSLSHGRAAQIRKAAEQGRSTSVKELTSPGTPPSGSPKSKKK